MRTVVVHCHRVNIKNEYAAKLKIQIKYVIIASLKINSLWFLYIDIGHTLFIRALSNSRI